MPKTAMREIGDGEPGSYFTDRGERADRTRGAARVGGEHDDEFAGAYPVPAAEQRAQERGVGAQPIGGARQVIDEEHAVEMIDLMLGADRLQPAEIGLLHLAIEIEPADGDLRRALDLRRQFRHGEAAFVVLVVVGVLGEDFGIEEGLKIPALAAFAGLALGAVAHVGDVDHENAAEIADLVGGEADAVGVVHGFQHVVHQLAHLAVDGLDRFGTLLETRVGSDDDRQSGQVGYLSENVRIRPFDMATVRPRSSRAGQRFTRTV